MEPTQTPKPEPRSEKEPMRLRSVGAKLALVGATGLLVGASAFGLSGVASAAAPTAGEPAIEVDADAEADVPDGSIHVEEFGPEDLSPEDEAVFEAFEQCLADAGFDEGTFGEELPSDPSEFELSEDELSEDEATAMDEAFDDCEPILDDLSDDLFGDGIGFEVEISPEDLRPEDEAVLEAFEQCLADAGFDEVEEGEAFADCESILDALSDDGFIIFDGADLDLADLDCPDLETADHDA